MVPVLHAGTPHRVSLRGFERSHPQLVCVLIREAGDGNQESVTRLDSFFKLEILILVLSKVVPFAVEP